MTSPVLEEHEFYWPSPWRKLSICAVVSVVAIVGGMGLGAVAAQVVATTESVFPAVFIGFLAVVLDLLGFLVLYYAVIKLISYAPGWGVVVWVRPESVWIYFGVNLFPKAEVFTYPAIVWVRMEHTQRGRQCIRIVHGRDLDTFFVDEMQSGDYERLLELLGERCPTAVTPTSPPGYEIVPYPQRTQPTAPLLADSTPYQVFPFGPNLWVEFLCTLFINAQGIILGIFCCSLGILAGTISFCLVPVGVVVLFIGVAELYIAACFKWWRLLRPAVHRKRRHEIRLTRDCIWIGRMWFDPFSGQEKPTQIAFESIRYIRRESWPENILIIFGSQEGAERIPRRWMEPTDFDELLAKLREYVPTVFAPDVEVGLRLRRVAPESSARPPDCVRIQPPPG